MAIRYVLVKNELSGQSGKYMAHVRPYGTATTEDVIERILEQSTTVGRADTVAVLAALNSVILDMVLEGMRVCTDLVCFSASVRGSFSDAQDQFDPRRHQVYPCVTAGKRLKQALRQHARLTKHFLKDPHPHVLAYADVHSGTRNSRLTPGGLGRAHGYRLKFAPDDPAQGIFFIGSDESATRVEHIAENTPRSLIFQVPDLTPGEYHLEVRTIIYDDGWVRSDRLEEPLTVL